MLLGFLAGIMRRYAQHAKPKLTLENGSVMTEKTKDDLDKEGVDHDVTNCISEEIADSNQVGIEPNIVVDATEVVTEESRRERKKKEQLEIKAILEEEGILDEMEGKQVRSCGVDVDMYKYMDLCIICVYRPIYMCIYLNTDLAISTNSIHIFYRLMI